FAKDAGRECRRCPYQPAPEENAPVARDVLAAAHEADDRAGRAVEADESATLWVVEERSEVVPEHPLAEAREEGVLEARDVDASDIAHDAGSERRNHVQPRVDPGRLGAFIRRA